MAKANENQVEIVPNEHGAKIRVSANNPEYAHVLLVQNKTWIAPSGWVRQRRMSTLLNGKVELIKELGLSRMKYLPGQIVIKEQLEPFADSNDPDRDIKYAGNTGVICCKEGEIIYRKTYYDATGLDTDVLVQHTNSDAIRTANKAVQNSEDQTDVHYDKTSMLTAEKFFTANDEENLDSSQTNIIDSIAEIEAENKTSMSYPNENEDEDQDDDYISDDDNLEEDDDIGNELVEVDEEDDDKSTFEL